MFAPVSARCYDDPCRIISRAVQNVALIVRCSKLGLASFPSFSVKIFSLSFLLPPFVLEPGVSPLSHFPPFLLPTRWHGWLHGPYHTVHTMAVIRQPSPFFECFKMAYGRHSPNIYGKSIMFQRKQFGILRNIAKLFFIFSKCPNIVGILTCHKSK